MKKFLSLVLAGVMCLGFAGCNGGKEAKGGAAEFEEVKDGKLTVGTTIYDPMN